MFFHNKCFSIHSFHSYSLHSDSIEMDKPPSVVFPRISAAEQEAIIASQNKEALQRLNRFDESIKIQ